MKASQVNQEFGDLEGDKDIEEDSNSTNYNIEKPENIIKKEETQETNITKTSEKETETNSSNLLGGVPGKKQIKNKNDNTKAEQATEPNVINPLTSVKLSNLTGKSGLKYAMQFDDNKGALIKGNFEYRPAFEKKFKRIFSREHIKKYSSKIANICNCIYPEQTRTLSKGIILIYSQYIDSGLIPIALALEEMGFKRYGKESKSLFKTAPPNPTISQKSKTNPTQLRYIMITGDKALSKNNDADIKAITDENNKDGDKIKVILISKAGSEGIDLKYIRQIHIIDPWYNMNTIEQIIGRGVRNFSHKGLPFTEHNVEIFLYATLLTGQDREEEKEESADLYVYRVAENKAIQIGKVSRLLKETSVDCILNHEQTTLTQEQFEQIGQKPVAQTLSYTDDSGITNNTISYKIGDVDKSSTCDYMQCEYTCKSLDENGSIIDIKKDSEKITEDTYNEKFIMSNLEKIMQKIKDIFLKNRHFFYTKTHIIELIKDPKPFPTVQIYAALSQLIYDKNEYIIDFYGRTGHLINIGEYYLFKPSELNFNNSSLTAFNISTPVDNKFTSIKINTGDREQQKAVHDVRNVQRFAKNNFVLEEDEGEEEGEETDSGIKEGNVNVLDKIKQQYHIALYSMQEYEKIVDKCPSDEELEEYSEYMTLQNKFRQKKITTDLTSEQNLRLKELAVKINKFKKAIKMITNPDKLSNNDLIDLNEYQQKAADKTISENEEVHLENLINKKEYSDNLTLTLLNNRLNLTQQKNIKSGFNDNNWYNHCGIAMYKLKNIPFVNKKIPTEKVFKQLEKCLIEHTIDTLLFAEKIELLNILYKRANKGNDKTNDLVESHAHEYLFSNSKIIKRKKHEYLILYDGKTKLEKNNDDDNRKILVLRGKSWDLASISESTDLKPEITKIKAEFKQLNLNDGINYFIGFISYEKKGDFLLFKTKDITNERNLAGARCDQTSKSNMLKYLNELVEIKLFTEITTKLSGQEELCAIEELIMRYYNSIQKNGKVWFFPPELTELYNLEHCKVKNKILICKND